MFEEIITGALREFEKNNKEGYMSFLIYLTLQLDKDLETKEERVGFLKLINSEDFAPLCEPWYEKIQLLKSQH